MRNKAIAIVVIMMLFVTGCGSSGSDTDSGEKEIASDFDLETNQTVTYGDISFEVPENWTVKDNEIFTEDEDGALAVTVEEGTYDMDQKENQEQAVEICAESYEDIQEVSRKTMTVLDDIPAFSYVFTGEDSTISTLWFSLKDHFYMLAFEELGSSSSSYTKEFDSIIDSLKEV